jgi:hypothetical protein
MCQWIHCSHQHDYFNADAVKRCVIELFSVNVWARLLVTVMRCTWMYLCIHASH